MKGGAPAAAGCMPAPILAAPPSAPSPCSNGGAAISALRSRGQEGSSRGAAPSLRWRSTPIHPPFACYARLGERDARGGLCRAPGLPRPVEARTMPPFMHKRGRDQEGSGGGSCARCPLRPERGRGREGEGVPLRAALHSPFVHDAGCGAQGERAPHCGAAPSPLPLPVVPLPCAQAKRGSGRVRGPSPHRPRGGPSLRPLRE